MGHRMNTREGRKRERLDVERRDAIGECLKLNPFYKPPSGYRPVLKEAKLFIPAKDHPGYNFIGLILGPRGNTQKRLETETGCRITIRGKGSIKDGKTLPYRHGKDNDGTSEDLHVHIAAETYEKVDAAVAIIEPLLIPVDEDRNIYKMKQLRELAEMNGTVFDLRRICTLCGEEGHRDWQCPKDKLQTFQAKVICRLCGDGSHPTMDCPLKLTGQGKTIDKEYLSFLEELGVGLGGIDPQVRSDLDNNTNGAVADTSQPMLLTASGAQPMPAKWMDGFNEFNRRMAAGGASGEPGGFPRLPFPFPFPPPGPQAMRFLAPLFNPAFFELFKGRPPPPPLQMMAFMFSAFRGRFPFPPFGFRPEMMRPPMPPSSTPDCPSSSMPMDVSAAGQDQAVNMAAEGIPQNNPEGLPSLNATSNEFEQTHSVLASSVTASAEVPMFSPSISNNSFSLESKPSPPLPAFSSVLLNNAELPPSGLAVSPVAPPPILPSVRLVPSIRPVIPSVLQPPTFTPVGGPGFAPSMVITPSGVGTSSTTNLSSLDAQPLPLQTWNSWSQGQSSLTSQSEKSASELTSSPGSLPPFPPKFDRPYFSAGEICPYPSGSDMSSLSSLHPTPSFPSPHPPSVPIPFRSYTPRPVPFGAPTSFMSNPLQPLPSQFGMAGDSQLKNYASSYPDSVLGPSSPLGHQSRSAGSMNAAPPLEDYSSFTPFSQRSTLGLARPASPMSHPAYAYQHASSFAASELPYPRAQEPLNMASADLHMHSNYRNSDVYQSNYRNSDVYQSGSRSQSAASSFEKDFRGTTSGSFDRNYKYEPSIPPHILQQNIKSPWSTDLLSRTRPEFQQAWGQQGMAGGRWLHPSAENAASRPSAQEVDPEYEKLMSSVGVL